MTRGKSCVAASIPDSQAPIVEMDACGDSCESDALLGLERACHRKSSE